MNKPISKVKLKANRKILSTHDYSIESSAQAAELSASLESRWNAESMLTQKVLIYLTSLIERQNDLLLSSRIR